MPPRQEVNRTNELNIAQSARNHESTVSGSDGYIDVRANVEPIYEKLDHSSEPPVSPYDVPPTPYVYMGCITSSANPVQQPPHVLSSPYVSMFCLKGSPNPGQQPHCENGNVQD